MSDVSLSKAVRSNLLSLQSTANSMAKTQTRLATGLKVNSALDNPTNFFTAASLNGRAGDMSNLLDAMSSGIKTIEAADNGLKSITKTVESMQSTLRQARQDKSFKSETFAIDTPEVLADGKIRLGGDAVDGSTVDLDATEFRVPFHSMFSYSDIDLSGAGAEIAFTATASGTDNVVKLTSSSATTLNIEINGTARTYNVADRSAVKKDEIASALNAAFDASGVGIAVTEVGGTIGFAPDEFGPLTSLASPVSGASAAGGAAVTNFAGFIPAASGTEERVRSVDDMARSINATVGLNAKVRASNDAGKLRIENLTNETLDINVPSDGSGTSFHIGGNEVRQNLVKQFNDLRDQLDKFADDASFNGINLLRGDKLKLTFNETGSSTIDIQAEDESGQPTSVNSSALGITEATSATFGSDVSIDQMLDTMKGALDDLRSQSSTFGSSLSVVENRNDFTKSMINTLETGAANLTLADTNQEAANLLALQTRQQLSSSALSMASQADQAVLRLF